MTFYQVPYSLAPLPLPHTPSCYSHPSATTLADAVFGYPSASLRIAGSLYLVALVPVASVPAILSLMPLLGASRLGFGGDSGA